MEFRVRIRCMVGYCFDTKFTVSLFSCLSARSHPTSMSTTTTTPTTGSRMRYSIANRLYSARLVPPDIYIDLQYMEESVPEIVYLKGFPLYCRICVLSPQTARCWRARNGHPDVAFRRATTTLCDVSSQLTSLIIIILLSSSLERRVFSITKGSSTSIDKDVFTPDSRRTIAVLCHNAPRTGYGEVLDTVSFPPHVW